MEKTITILGILAVVIAVFALLIAVIPAIYNPGINGAQQEDSLSVQGTSVIETSPDEVVIDVGIETKAATALQAQTANKEISNKILDAIKGQGVKEDEIESVAYHLDEWMDWTEKGSVPRGYIQRHTLRITIQNIDQAGNLADVAVKAGANEIQGIRFQLSREKQEEVTKKALSEATGKARAKAEAIAEPLGKKIKGIVSVSDTSGYGGGYPMPYFAESASMKLERDASAPPTQVLPGKIEVRGSVDITFKIK